MPQAPNYPTIDIWDSLFNELNNDSYLQSILSKNVQGDIALYQEPLTKETIIFSDSGLAVGVGYFLERTVSQINGLDVTFLTFKIDVASCNENFMTACKTVDNLGTDVQFTLESKKCFKGAVFDSVSVTPTEPLSTNSFWIVMQTYNFTMRVDNIYRWN